MTDFELPRGPPVAAPPDTSVEQRKRTCRTVHPYGVCPAGAGTPRQEEILTMDRWYCLPYLDGPLKGATALFGFWPAESIPVELPGGHTLAPKGLGYTLAPANEAYAYTP